MTRLQNNANFAQTIDITQIFGNNAASRRAVYQDIGDVLSADGVFVAVGLPDGAQLQRHANALLRFFELSGEEKLRLATRRVRADSRRSYRGFVATLTEGWAYNEFFDIGPDQALGAPANSAVKMFVETNCWPAQPPFPEWRAEMLRYRQTMEKTGAAILAAAAAYLGLGEKDIASRFANAGSTLRLLNYPRKPNEAAIIADMPEPDGARLISGRHVDAAAFSLLWQREGGLQAQTPDGRWLDIPLAAGNVSVHIGTVMEFLTAGRWRATPHRVLNNGAPRASIGYFHEPNLDADLSPLLPVTGNSAPQHSGLTYGAHLLDRFGRYEGLEDLAAPAGN